MSFKKREELRARAFKLHTLAAIEEEIVWVNENIQSQPSQTACLPYVEYTQTLALLKSAFAKIESLNNLLMVNEAKAQVGFHLSKGEAEDMLNLSAGEMSYEVWSELKDTISQQFDSEYDQLWEDAEEFVKDTYDEIVEKQPTP